MADMVLLHPSIMTMIYENGWVGDRLADVSQSPLFDQYSSAMQKLVNTDLLAACGVAEAFPKGNVAYTICPSWYVPKLKEAAPEFNDQLTAIPASGRGAIVAIRAGWPVAKAMSVR